MHNLDVEEGALFGRSSPLLLEIYFRSIFLRRENKPKLNPIMRYRSRPGAHSEDHSAKKKGKASSITICFEPVSTGSSTREDACTHFW